MMIALAWIGAIVLIVVGFAGTVLPAVPGVVAIFLGALLAAWIEHFERIGIGAGIGLAVGTLARVAIGVAMIVIFLAALVL